MAMRRGPGSAARLAPRLRRLGLGGVVAAMVGSSPRKLGIGGGHPGVPTTVGSGGWVGVFAPVPGDQYGQCPDGFGFFGGRHGDRLDSSDTNVGNRSG